MNKIADEAGNLYEQHKNISEELEKQKRQAEEDADLYVRRPKEASSEFDHLSDSDRRAITLDYLRELQAFEESLDDKGWFHSYEYGHPYESAIDVINKYAPKLEAKKANDLQPYKSNLFDAREHFDSNEEAYKEQAVQDYNLARAEDPQKYPEPLKYPEYTEDNSEKEVSNQIETSKGLVTVSSDQSTTRSDELHMSGEVFNKDSIDFTAVESHLAIHQDGQVAGSQFSGEMFSTSTEIIDFIRTVLPESIEYDSNGMAELTLDIKTADNKALGFTGVKSIEELQKLGVTNVEKGVRTPGGEPAILDGVSGAWYPEVARTPSGAFEVVTNDDGSIKNPHGKFEPEATIATVSDPDTLRTSKVSIIIRKDIETGLPVVLTIFPGENAPMYPAKIQTETYSADSLSGKAADFWKNHAFIKFQ